METLSNLNKIDDSTVIEKSELLKCLPFSTVCNGISQSGKSETWLHYKKHSKVYVFVNSLPKQSLSKVKQFLESKVQEGNILTAEDNNIEYLYNILQAQVSTPKIYQVYKQYYDDYIISESKKVFFSKKHAVSVKLVTIFLSKDFSLYEQTNAVKKVYEDTKSFVFKCSSESYYSQKLKSICAHNDIVQYVLSSCDKKLKNYRKLSPEIKEKIYNLYKQNKPFLRYKDIKDKVNKELIDMGLKILSLSTVKKVLRPKEVKNRLNPFRYGPEYEKKKLDPPFYRKLPLNIHDKWEIDGTCLPFYSIIDGRISRYWFFIIVEVHSRRIIGYSIDVSENGGCVYNAFLNAVINVNELPIEIVRDGSSAYKSELVQNLFERIKKRNVEIRVATSAQDNGTVEKVFDILHTQYFSRYENFIGDNWKSDREIYRANPEHVYEIRKLKNLVTSSDIRQIVNKSIHEFNTDLF